MAPASRTPLLRRSFLVAAVIVAGLALSLLACKTSLDGERDLFRAQLVRRADVHGAITREVINNFEGGLFGLCNLFIGSAEVTRSEFTEAARRMLARYPGITALEWVPIVPDADRAAVESAVSRQLGRQFQFVVPGADGRMQPSPAAAEHYPILYVEPIAGNEHAFGYDLAFGPTTDLLRRARLSRKMAVSRRIRLVQETKANRYSVIFAWPVFKTTAPTAPCMGFIQGVFRLDDLMVKAPTMARAHRALDILYLDPTKQDAADRQILFDPADGEATATPPPALEAEFRRGPHRAVRLPVGDRQWIALYRPSDAWLESVTTRHPLWLLLSGLTMTGLLAGLVHVLGRRSEVIAAEVEERTAELKESRRQLDSLVQALPGMAYRCTVADEVTMLYTSEGAAALTGYSAAEFMDGQAHVGDIIHPDDLPVVRQLTRDALHEKRMFELEYRIRTRDGALKWVLTRGRPVFDAHGQPLFFEGLIIDITARRQAETDKLAIERRLLESQKLESLGLLASGVAHDFNNLLTTIVGHAGLARLDQPAGSAALNCLQQIELASQHAAELCQQMLAYAGKGRLSVEQIDLNAVITAMRPLLQSSISRAVTLHLELAPQLPDVTGDPSQLRQILMNLVINASDAIGEQAGRITLVTQVQDIGLDELARCATGRDLAAGKYVVLEVRDTGRGMSPATLERIFDPFFTTKFAGRGLGLAAVLGIVRGHHGALDVTTSLGAGAVFKLILPEARMASAGPARADAAERPRALVVDDDEPVRLVTSELLRSMGYEAETAATGEAALAWFQAEDARFDLVLLDIVMPGIDGLETLRRLRALKPGVHVLLMSGHAEHGAKHEFAAEGPAAFITKPFNRNALETRLRELFNG
jgi:PAS domain S-box-containing protein